MKKTFIMSAKGDVDFTGLPTDMDAFSTLVAAQAMIQFNSDGTWSTDTNPEGGNGDNMSGNYISGGTLGSFFELSYSWADSAGGENIVPSPAMTQGTWYPLNITRSFTLTDTDATLTSAGTLTISIRKISNPSNTDTIAIPFMCDGECISSDTYVLLPNGSFKQAKDLTLEDTLTSFYVPGMIYTDDENWETWTTTDISNSTEQVSNIVALKTFVEQSYIRINDLLETTSTHTNFIKRDGVYQYVRSKYLQIGDFLVKRDRSEIEIVQLETVNEEKSFTHINVEDVDTFFVKMGEDVIVTHNAS